MDDLGIMNTGVLLWGEYSIDIAEKEKNGYQSVVFFWIFTFKNWISMFTHYSCTLFANFYDIGIFVHGFKS